MQNKVKCVVFPGRLYDTAGQEDYDRLRPIGYTGTDVFAICFSIEDRVSMFNVKQKWIPEIKHYCPNTPYILVGTKTDLRRKYKMTIPKEEGINFAKAVKAFTYVECSAKSQEGLHEVFDEAISATVRCSSIKRAKCHLL
ncbi:unnamed protein product [Hermetia illucens]|uniref:Uncharacterized protein n=1 Tax=Hermetia illucens TaxID=343691 RepID=A0A7R8YWU0_HERIL|nr:unnamed protein product [Hermetia illucens]